MTAILLATYNGGPWLDEQLASLFAQTDQNWHLWVSDDRSCDATAAVLAHWRARHPDRITVTHQPENLGYRENFRWLLKSVEADEYFLCDQDDVWLPEKVARCRLALGGIPPRRPAVAFCDLEVVDEALRPLHPSLWALQRTDPSQANDLRRLSVINVVTGCAAVLNRSARNLVADADLAPAHDHAIALHVLRAGGILVPVPLALVRYRQHGANSIGARPFLAGLTEKLRSFRTGWGPPLAARAVEWGLFPSRAAYYRYKARLWVERATGR